MRPVCIDASFTVRLVLPGPSHDRALEVWAGWAADDRRIIAPQLWLLEVANALWRLQAGSPPVLTAGTAREALEYVLQLPVELYNLDQRIRQLWDEVLVGRRVSTAYDAAYVLTAVANQAELWTCDRRLSQEAAGACPVHLLE